MNTIDDFKLGDWVVTKSGDEGKVTLVLDPYVYVTLEDGNYVYYYPDEIEHATVDETSPIVLLGLLKQTTKRNKRAQLYLAKLAEVSGFNWEDL